MAITQKDFARFVAAKPKRPRITAILFIAACELALASGVWGVHALIAR